MHAWMQKCVDTHLCLYSEYMEIGNWQLLRVCWSKLLWIAAMTSLTEGGCTKLSDGPVYVKLWLWLGYLNTWFPVDGPVWGGNLALLENFCYWGKDSRVLSFRLQLALSRLPLKMCSLRVRLPHLLFDVMNSQPWWSYSWKQLFCRSPWVVAFCPSDRQKVTNRPWKRPQGTAVADYLD